MDLTSFVQSFGDALAVNTAVSNLPWPPKKLVVGVSGGPDSLALLHVLHRLWGADRLVIAHLNHGLRAGAGEDADFVAQTAVSLDIPCHVHSEDVTAQAQAQGLSWEEAGRQARYRFFAFVADQEGATAVAVGHNADDQAETVIMHLLRGSGLAGLRGMEPVAPLPHAPHIWLVRPFLSVARADIEQYCHEHQLQPREDSSNLDTRFFRNRLRHHLLPLLAEYNPQIQKRLHNLATVVAADEALLFQLQQKAVKAILQEQDDDWLAFDRARWLALPLSLRRRTLRQMIWTLRPALRDVTFRPLEHARLLVEQGEGRGQAALPGGLVLALSYDRVYVAADLEAIPMRWPQLPHDELLPLPVPGQVTLANGWVLETAVLSQPDIATIQANPDSWQAFIPLENAPLFLRSRQPGERFRPFGLDGQSARLKETMINRKIPALLRPRWPIVANAQHLLWLVGHQLDERARVTDFTMPVLHLRCYRSTQIDQKAD